MFRRKTKEKRNAIIYICDVTRAFTRIAVLCCSLAEKDEDMSVNICVFMFRKSNFSVGYE